MIEICNWENGLLLQLPSFPKTPAEYQPLIDSNDPSKLEDLLMEHFDTAPQDIAFYLPAYRAFIRKQEVNRASALLGLQVESLRAHGDLTPEIHLLAALLGFWQDCTYAREQLLGHLKTMYADSPNFIRYTQHFPVLENDAGIAAFRRLEQWLRYDEGRVVYMPAKGVARIREANPNIGVVRLVLKNDEPMTLRIDEAERLAQPLRNSHFLARTIIDRDTLNQVNDNDPGELLRLLFASIGREVTLNELREMLSAVVPDAEWNTWWARARKDSRLIVGAGTKPNLSWNDSIAEGSAGLMATFMEVSPYEKLAMLKKYAARSESMTVAMAQVLADEAEDTLESDPSLALEIVLTINRIAQCKEIAMPGTAEDLLAESDADTVIADIRDRLTRRKAIQIVAHSREDWPRIYGALLKTETDTASIKLLYESLHTAAHLDHLTPVVERAFLYPSATPQLYLWLCRELPKRPELHPHANRDFLHSLCEVLDDSSFKGHRSALRKLFDPGEAVDRAIETLDSSNCRSLLDALLRVRELEDYIKESVRQKFFGHFPELHETKQEFLLVTREALDNKRVEFEKLVKEDIPKNAREIQRTREYGDLRENFEYHEARRMQELLSSRAKSLHDELITARPIEPGAVDTSKISIGSRFRLQPEAATGATVTLTILGPWDSDPSKNILSYTSAAAETLLGAPKGSTVTFSGAEYVVDGIEVWVTPQNDPTVTSR